MKIDTKEKFDAAVEEHIKRVFGVSSLEELKKEREEQQKALQELSREYTRDTVHTHMPKAYLKRAAPLIAKDIYQGAGLTLGCYARTLATAMVDRKDPKDIALKQGNGWLAERIEEIEGIGEKALGYSILADGGSLVNEQFFAEIIPILEAESIVFGLNPTIFPMESSTLRIPRETVSPTAAFRGENVEQNATQGEFGDIKLTVKHLQIIIPLSNEFLRLNSVQADRFLRNRMLQRMMLRADLAFLRGDGANDTPKGVKNLMDSNNSDTVTTGGASTLEDIVDTLFDMVEDVEGKNVKLRNAAFAMSSRTKSGIARTLDSNGNFVFKEELKDGMLLGHPVAVSNQIPNDLGGSNDESEIQFGAWDELVIGQVENLELKAFDGGTYRDSAGNLRSGISANQTVLRATMGLDSQVAHEGAFSERTAVDWGA